MKKRPEKISQPSSYRESNSSKLWIDSSFISERSFYADTKGNTHTGFKLEEKLLWAAALPKEEVSLKFLENNLDILYLESEGTDDWNMSPRETHLLRR